MVRFASSEGGLISQGVAIGLLRGVRAIERPAEFATIDFGVWADERRNIFRVVVPALQMARTELTLFVFFVAGALPGLARLDFRRCCFFRHGALSTNRGHGTSFSARFGRCATLPRRRWRIRIAEMHRRSVPDPRRSET